MHNKGIQQLEQDAIEDLFRSIYSEYGYDFSNYAAPSIRRRISHFMVIHKIESIAALKTRVLADDTFFENFIQDTTVTVTEMFRDPNFYRSLRKHVLPRLATYPFIKVWVAGCATGEEVYSVAILLKEYGLLTRSFIYATDINQHSLETARHGIFPIARMKHYTVNYQLSGGGEDFSTYYKSRYHAALFDKSLRNRMVFASHNLATDQSFGEFQLILCRNVLIYFNQTLQQHVLSLFNNSLCVFGFLGLGSKESLLSFNNKTQFETLDRKENIFMKVR